MILWTAVLAASGLREGVLNLRPVSPSLPGLYRSAAYERATAADAAEILDGLRIRTVIDLRNNDEIHRAQATATPYGRALFAAYRDGARVGPGQLASEGTGRLHRVHLRRYLNQRRKVLDVFCDQRLDVITSAKVTYLLSRPHTP